MGILLRVLAPLCYGQRWSIAMLRKPVVPAVLSMAQRSVQECGTLEATIAERLKAHPGHAGVRLVSDGLEAFALRVQSARLATCTLDVQTYIWRDDPTGRVIAHELLQAADRGVRVGGRKVLPAAMTGAMIVAVADRAKILNAATRLRCRNSTARWCRMRKAWIP